MSPDTPPGSAKRFNQRYTAFARANWDPTCLAYNRPTKSPEALAASGKPGYSPEAFALHAGAWAVARQKTTPHEAKAEPEASKSPLQQRSREQGSCDRSGLTRQVKDAARLYGASLVGIAPVNPLWVYEPNGDGSLGDLPEGLGTAVVIAVAMDYPLIRTSPAVPASAATGNGYSQMAFTGACLAKYLTELGWRAQSSGNDTALSIPLAVDAGLGELGRNGMLITVPFGPRVRICKVFTDAPLLPDRPLSFGVREFCRVCRKCADACPSGSIPRGARTQRGPTPSNSHGLLKWYVNADKCLNFWRVNGTSCSNCIRSCPFNKAPGLPHQLARAVVKLRSLLVDRALVTLDDWLGYGTQRGV